MPWSLPSLLLLPALLLAGCAASAPEVAGAGAAADPPSRWMLTWHRPLPVQAEALAAFEAEAGAIAGLPVRRVAAVSERVVAVTLACDTAPRCTDAVARLRADPRVTALVTDARRRALAP